MISFTQQEIFASILSATLYGVFFAILFSFILLIKGIISGLKEGVKRIVRFKRIFPLPTVNTSTFSVDPGAFATAVTIMLFGIGFSLLSYCSLDGEIRLYMLILSFASFYLSKFAFFGFLSKVSFCILNTIFLFLSLLIRAVISLSRAIFFKVSSANIPFPPIKSKK